MWHWKENQLHFFKQISKLLVWTYLNIVMDLQKILKNVINQV